jgi:hypothetical protein
VGWLRLSDATSIMDHDVQKARVALERGISKSWLERPGGIPQPASDPNVPLRIQVVPSSGWRLEGRAWLESPVLHWEESEIECPGKPCQRPPLKSGQRLRCGKQTFFGYGDGLETAMQSIRSQSPSSISMRRAISQLRLSPFRAGDTSRRGTRRPNHRASRSATPFKT